MSLIGRTVTILLEAGADLEQAVPMDENEGDFRATPLWYAVARGQSFPLVEFLLKRSADASYSLWAAVWRDDDLVCRALLESKPELNLKAHGETPIFYAARLKRLTTLVLLIDAGADPTIPDSAGRDSVAIARERKLPEEIIEQMASLITTIAGRIPVWRTGCWMRLASRCCLRSKRQRNVRQPPL